MAGFCRKLPLFRSPRVTRAFVVWRNIFLVIGVAVSKWILDFFLFCSCDASLSSLICQTFARNLYRCLLRRPDVLLAVIF